MNQSMYYEQMNQTLPRLAQQGYNVRFAGGPPPQTQSRVAPNLHEPISALGGLHNAISPATGMDAGAMFRGNRPASMGHFDAIMNALRGAR